MKSLRERYEELKEKRSGDTCVIIGNGPSLKNVPLKFLQKYDSFGSNRIFLLDGFMPTYYVAVNPLVIQQSMEGIQSLSCPCFISDQFYVPFSLPLHSRNVPHFSVEPWDGVFEGFTVTFVSLQLAYALGYTTVLMVGVDHRYEYTGNPNQEVVSESKDVNHFHPNYFGFGFKWHLPDLARSEASYHMARTRFEADGRRIINVTANSALTVFETDMLENWA